ncbi:MAG: thiamine-phosphate kinase [Rhodospirillaceae bacterium]
MNARSTEFDLIEALFAPLSKDAPGAFGLKDDAARLISTPGYDVIMTVDTVISGVHFHADDPPALIAQKALRVNLSDLAAKGARPLGFLQALSLNDSISDDFLRAYAAGLAADVATYSVPLFGGDTTSGPGPLAISITAYGEVPRGQMILRSGAGAGDLICVTGTVGDGALGLACLAGDLEVTPEHAAHLVARYRVPEPRLAAGAALRGHATACLDISDGLVADVGHICKTSGVAAVIERDLVPLSAAGRAALQKDPALWTRVLGGGDDYELAFTIPGNERDILARIAGAAGICLTVIGRIVGPENAKVGSVTVVDGTGRPVEVPVGGYRHR